MFLTVALALPASAQSLERAFQLLDAENFPAAVEAFDKALAASPGDAKAHEGLAWAYYGMRAYDRAARHADHLLATSSADWRRSWAIIVWEMPERRDEVLAAVRGWAAEDSSDRAAQHLLAKVLADSGAYAEGRAVLDGLLASDPDDVEALTIRARIERWDQQFEAARVLLVRAAALRPEDEAIRQDLLMMTREAGGHRVAHLEPTLPLVLIVILMSVLIGQGLSRLTPVVRVTSLAGISGLVGAALAWLYIVPLG